MQYLCRSGYVVNRKHSRFGTVGKNGFQVVYLFFVKFLANIFHQPYIPEKVGTKRSVACDNLFDYAEPGKGKHHQLIIGWQVTFNHILQGSIQLLEFRPDNRFINIFLVFKIGIKRSASISRCFCNLVHCRSVNGFFCKKLPGYFDEVSFCFGCCDSHKCTIMICLCKNNTKFLRNETICEQNGNNRENLLLRGSRHLFCGLKLSFYLLYKK
ncbi:hypothetical protein SDC9_132266 [bioreactor metagenome]|uniref:Uncharacterized protein n=1 Tax=bioreactor metagenome TaxID=1076179 RepID=A0A645D7Z9_9ZZZZ